ncbi:MAG TPA: PCP reductase family protein [Nitrospiraceae bacterium]|nr:PCP reductase family protein [Nitrospiraceae bacterium]
MHTEGVDECWNGAGASEWMVRLECRRCAVHIGAIGTPDETVKLVDRFLWSDAARHALERLPPYVQALVKPEAETFARSQQQRLMTWALLGQARHGGQVDWDIEAEQRLEKVPVPVRAMARQELERTALDKGQSQVTVALMEEVKGRYFGMFKGSSQS